MARRQGLQPVESYQFGGVDSRSNPANFPRDRALRVRNLIPSRDGELRLRDGYAEVAMDTVVVSPLHSLYPFRVIGGSRYVVFAHGTILKLENLATNAVTVPTVRGAAIASSARWSYALAFNRLHAVNGTDKKFFDGTTWRDIGYDAPTQVIADAVNVTVGTANPAAVAASAVGGVQPGYQLWMCYYNPTTKHMGNRIKIGKSGVVGTAIAAAPGGAVRATNVVTITTTTNHGLITGQRVAIDGITDTSFDGSFNVTVTGATTFTYAQTGANATSGAGTVTLKSRVVPSAASEVNLTTLPDLSGVDTELVKLIGRTGDGAEVPYPFMDDGGNWITVANAVTTATISVSQIDGTTELPTRNGLPPNLTGLARVGNRLMGITAGGPWIYSSESGVDDADGHAGRPEQSWPGTAETFPTGSTPTCIGAYNMDAWIYTLNDLAVLQDQQTQFGWQGPWNGFGCLGQGAWCLGWKGVPYWINGEKQLCCAAPDGPIAISDEYEKALLAKIGDAYASTTEISYYRHADDQKDHLLIKAKDSDGNPFVVIHDFLLRDERSPYGQGYEYIFGGALASDFTLAVVRDNADHSRLWAGASNGRLYQMFDGITDDGTEFDGDWITLAYLGPDRVEAKIIEWFGDSTLKWYISKDLTRTFADINDFFDLTANGKVTLIPGDESGIGYSVPLPAPEIVRAYLWLRLSSHSADAPAQGMGLNTPPHFPVETYGRIYGVSPLLGTARGK